MLLGPIYARYAFLVNMLSWSMCYSMARTVANSTETVLLLVSLKLWISVNGPSGPLSLLSMRASQASNTAVLDSRRKIDPVRDLYLPFPQWTYVLPAVSSWCRPTSLCFWAVTMGSDVVTKIMSARTSEVCKSWGGFIKTGLRIICAAGKYFLSTIPP
jgi:hypothetical protein